ncbi:MAG: alpha/beta hydrolase [Clostridiaceae bacterium]|nr:alpha/beta hydrolase [Clostridiaceae bacterium]
MNLLIIVVIVVFVLTFFAAINYGAEYTFKAAFLGKRKTKEDCYKRIDSFGALDEKLYDSYNFEDVETKSKEGFLLKGHLLENYNDSNNYIILVHGYTADYYMHLPFVELFKNEGFNILMVEQRAHGSSGGDYASYGFFERDDLDRWVDFLEARKGEKLFIGLHGQSMGAASVMMCGARNKKVEFVIEDCGYSSAKAEVMNNIRKVKYVPPFSVYTLANYKTRKRCGFGLEEASPIDEIMKSKVPILFIHGDADKKVPHEMCLEMYNKRKNKEDEILIVHNAVHLNAYEVDKEKYTKAVHNFIEKCRG